MSTRERERAILAHRARDVGSWQLALAPGLWELHATAGTQGRAELLTSGLVQERKGAEAGSPSPSGAPRELQTSHSPSSGPIPSTVPNWDLAPDTWTPSADLHPASALETRHGYLHVAGEQKSQTLDSVFRLIRNCGHKREQIFLRAFCRFIEHLIVSGQKSGVWSERQARRGPVPLLIVSL